MVELKKIIKFMKDLAEPIRMLVRAKSGLPLGDTEFAGLVDVKDLRERTRISYHDALRHTFMRLVAQEGGNEWEIFEKLADMEDHYYISLEGEQRREMILARSSQSNLNVTTNQPNVTLPQVDTKQKLSEPVSSGTKK